MKKMALLATLLTSILVLGAAPFAMAQDTTQGGKDDKEKGTVILLVPPLFAFDAALADGCWARLYEGTNYRGEVRVITGPATIPGMRVGTNSLWSGKYDSVIVGPKATLTVYDNEYYKDKAARFPPGQQVPDLDDKLGFFENIRSLQLACNK